jgi:hypothetical protein
MTVFPNFFPSVQLLAGRQRLGPVVEDASIQASGKSKYIYRAFRELTEEAANQISQTDMMLGADERPRGPFARHPAHRPPGWIIPDVPLFSPSPRLASPLPAPSLLRYLTASLV